MSIISSSLFTHSSGSTSFLTEKSESAIACLKCGLLNAAPRKCHYKFFRELPSDLLYDKRTLLRGLEFPPNALNITQNYIEYGNLIYGIDIAKLSYSILKALECRF